MFIWAVRLKNTIIGQFDQNGKENRFGDIDLSQAVSIGWYPIREGLPSYEILLQAGDVPILLRRHQVGIQSGKDEVLYYLL